MLKLIIDGQPFESESGRTILQVCRENGIEIPTLCHMERILPDGSCRVCVVEVKGARTLIAACSAPIADGMEISTCSERVIEARRTVLDLILSSHRGDCFNCKQNGMCDLQSLCEQYGVTKPEFPGGNPEYPIDTSNPFYDFDRNKCVLCRKCVNTCASLQCANTLSAVMRGLETHVAPAFDKPMSESTCVSCGNCVSNCPTGALTPKRPGSYVGVEKVLTTCTYCGVGCQMYLCVKRGKIVDVLPANGASNEGMLCVKGKFAYGFIDHPDRLKTPLIRKNSELVPATWDEAMSVITSKINETRKAHGADAIAGFSSARCTNEENYLFQKLMRGVIGTNNVDHCARLCHASTVAGLAITLGSGAMTNTIAEILNQQVIFVTGSNTTEAHPVIGAKIRQALKNGAKLIVAEPRRIELAEQADVFLQIKPGTNIALYNGLLNVILAEGLEDKKFIAERCENFDEVEALVREYTPERVAEICGVDASDIRKAAIMYANAERAGIYYAMGVTQFSTGTMGVTALSNLALASGKLGKESCGINPLRGQNNVQGACDMGSLPGDFPGYQKVMNPDVIAKFEKAWGVETLSNKPGLTITEVMNACGKQIQMLYIMGENPMISDPDINHVEHQLKKLDFLVVQDIFLTETAELADVVLPAASFAEKDGTFTNTERRIQRIRRALSPVGQARPDWEILCDLSKRLGYDQGFTSAAEIMDEIASVTPSYGGICYDRLDTLNSPQWPCPDKNHPGTRYLHAEKFTRLGGKAVFGRAVYSDPKEVPDADYPLIFTTGRILYHYHTRSMTGRVDGLNEIAGASYVEINPEDAARLGITDGGRAKVSSRRGELVAAARVTDRVESGVVFMPFHFADGAANLLTNPVVDAVAKIPELKVCACRVERG